MARRWMLDVKIQVREDVCESCGKLFYLGMYIPTIGINYYYKDRLEKLVLLLNRLFIQGLKEGSLGLTNAQWDSDTLLDQTGLCEKAEVLIF